MSFEIKIDRNYIGVKPKNFLKKNLDLPYYKILKLIKEKRITLNGKKIKQDSILAENDIIKIWPENIHLKKIESKYKNKKNLNLEILFENQDFIIFNKLPGIIVQGAQDNSTSLSLHLAYYKAKIKDTSSFDYFHVHRLDKDTSGILVVAKNQVALRNLNQIFREKKITKKYLCLVVGKPKKNSDKIEVFMKRTKEGSREKMKLCSQKESGAKKTFSFYKLIKTYKFKDEIFSLIEVEIKTGVTHQIRVHMKSLGCPILGDKMYGNLAINQKFQDQLSRQFLHASYLEFTYNNKTYNFTAPFTPDLEEFLNYLEIKNSKN